MVNILQHISHCGIRSICNTGQRHRVPPAHLDQTWIYTQKWKLWENYRLVSSVHVCAVYCTFGLCGRAVWVAQRQQGHLYQLVKQQISLDQHKLSMFFSPLSLQRAFLVLHHAEYRQQAPWGDGHKWCHTAWHWRLQCIQAGSELMTYGEFFNHHFWGWPSKNKILADRSHFIIKSYMEGGGVKPNDASHIFEFPNLQCSP